MRTGPIDIDRRLSVLGLFLPFTAAVGLIVDGASIIPIGAHESVFVVRVEGAARAVPGYLHVVDAETVSLGIAIGE